MMRRRGVPIQNVRGTWKVAAPRRGGGLFAARREEGVAHDREEGTSVSRKETRAVKKYFSY